jgi:hypothetical protein
VGDDDDMDDNDSHRDGDDDDGSDGDNDDDNNSDRDGDDDDSDDDNESAPEPVPVPESRDDFSCFKIYAEDLSKFQPTSVAPIRLGCPVAPPLTPPSSLYPWILTKATLVP